MQLKKKSKNSVAVDLTKCGFDTWERSAQGLSFTYDLLEGKEKVHRKGRREVRSTMRGYGTLNADPLGWSPWVDPQADLDNLEKNAGEIVTVQTDNSVNRGDHFVAEATVNYREARPFISRSAGNDEDFLEYDWTLELIEVPPDN